MSYERLPNEDPDLDHKIDNEDDDDDEEEVNATQPFQPGASSTPYTPGAAYHPGEEYEMTNLPREQSGSGDTIPEAPEFDDFVYTEDKETLVERFKSILRDRFPRVNFAKIVVGLGGKPGNVGKAVAKGPKRGETPIFKKDRNLTQAFINQYGSFLGPPKEPEIIVEDREGLAETNQRLKEAQQLEQNLNKEAGKQQKAIQERQAQENKLEQINQRIANLENEGGTLLERQNETDRLNRQAAKIKRDIEEAKDKEKDYAQTTKEREKVKRLQRKYDDQQQKTAIAETRFNKTKPLDELKQKADELNQKINEDIHIIEDENTSPSDREAARDRLAVRNEELEGVSEEIEVRERQRPLLERIREIFKKYGWTLQAVVLAAGITISAVVLSTLNGLAKATKAIGNGLKELGKKAAAALPGLIGSIVGFIFKTAGSVISFLGKHAWLLILAVVAFPVERVTKRARKS